MIDRRTWWRIGAAGALPLSMLAGLLWHSSYEPEYVAYGRLSVPAAVVAVVTGPRGLAASTLEEAILSPENVTAAADLVRSRGIILSTVSPLDSDVEELFRRVDAGHEQCHDHSEVRVSFRTPDGEQAIPVLSAVLDACLAALDHAAPRIDETAAAGRDFELHDLSDELLRREEVLAELEQKARRSDASQLDPSLLADRIRSIESSLVKATEQRIAAEDRLADIHQQLGAGFTAEQIAERLPEHPESAATRDQVVTTRAREELKQQLDALDRAAAVYGRNHPRLIQIRSDVDRLKHESGVVRAGAQVDEATRSPSAVLLKSQEGLLNQATLAEQELQTQLDRTVADHKSRLELNEQLALARDEISPLRERHGELKKQVASAALVADSQKATISEPPALAPEAIVPSLSGYLAWSGCLGLIFAAGLWRKSHTIRRVQPTPILLSGPKLPVVVDWGKPAKKPAPPAAQITEPALIPTIVAEKSQSEPELAAETSDSRPAAADEPVADSSPSEEDSESPIRPRERFRSQEEENLARLKRLSMQTA